MTVYALNKMLEKPKGRKGKKKVYHPMLSYNKPILTNKRQMEKKGLAFVDSGPSSSSKAIITPEVSPEKILKRVPYKPNCEKVNLS